jgi:hypothetical protein
MIRSIFWISCLSSKPPAYSANLSSMTVRLAHVAIWMAADRPRSCRLGVTVIDQAEA